MEVVYHKTFPLRRQLFLHIIINPRRLRFPYLSCIRPPQPAHSSGGAGEPSELSRSFSISCSTFCSNSGFIFQITRSTSPLFPSDAGIVIAFCAVTRFRPDLLQKVELYWLYLYLYYFIPFMKYHIFYNLITSHTYLINITMIHAQAKVFDVLISDLSRIFR